MRSIKEFARLINEIPLDYQSSFIKRNVWDKISYKNKNSIESGIYNKKNFAEISRIDIRNEGDICRKIVKILMWGYPSGGRGKNIEKILKDIVQLRDIFNKYQEKNLLKKDAVCLLKRFDCIGGLGPSTWSKLLYFFNISFESHKCQIFDLKIVDSLNKNQFIEFPSKKWQQTNNDYFEYIELLNTLEKKYGVASEKIEGFLFHYNLNYKFS